LSFTVVLSRLTTFSLTSLTVSLADEENEKNYQKRRRRFFLFFGNKYIASKGRRQTTRGGYSHNSFSPIFF
jgi:uncharacterized protein (DUF1330 family)